MACTTAEATESPLEIELTNKSTRRDGTGKSEGRKRRHKNTIRLWEFLLDLLANDDLRTIIYWSRREFQEFKLLRPEEVARRWGLVKRRQGMNYKKLSRALRFYYGQGIVQKVPGQPFTYKFDNLPYKYEPRVSQSSDQKGKTSTCDRVREKMSSDKCASHKGEQSVFSSSSGQSTLSPTHTSEGTCVSPCLVPISADTTQGNRETEEPGNQTKRNISNLCRNELKTTIPPVLIPKRNKLNIAKSIPVPVIKRVASNDCQGTNF